MKQILTIVTLLTSLASYSQDTLCVMICLDEVINFNYETSKIINRFDHTGDYEIKVKEGEVMCLHLCDDKKRYRDITTTFEDGDHTHNTFDSKDNVIFSKESWGNFTIHVSEAKRRK
jgi:hypothetical protein